MSFNERVYELVCQVPGGHVSTYGDIATLLGSPRRARQVGFALAALRDPEVPWHRIINSKGYISLRGDTLRGRLQRALLEAEGLRFDDQGRIDLMVFRWHHSLRQGKCGESQE